MFNHTKPRHAQAVRIRQVMTQADIEACDRADRLINRAALIMILLQVLVIAWLAVQLRMGGA